MRVTVVGAGYVGLVSAVGLAELGHQVTVVEQAATRRDLVASGRAPFHEPGLDDALTAELRSGRLRVDDRLGQPGDATIIAVGTPSRDGVIDLSAVLACVDEIADTLHNGTEQHVVVVRSTVVPGTTLGPVSARLATRTNPALVVACSNPEFLREGTALADFRQPDRIVVGAEVTWAGDRVAELYRTSSAPVIRTSSTSAEMIKYTSNALLATLVSFANEISSLCEAIDDVDVATVFDAVHQDRRWVVDGARPEILSYLRPGCGFGGSCLPKDVEALASRARQVGVEPYLLNGVLERNRSRAAQMCHLLEASGITIAGSRIAVLGLAFKPGTDDVRRSPSLEVVRELVARGAEVHVHDPIALDNARSELPDDVHSHRELDSCVRGVAAAVVATAWPEYVTADWSSLAAVMAPGAGVVDGRNALRNIPETLHYIPVGRRPVRGAS
jgi:UDPglucose 6-dehydrogenase/GDP-mannose 6-dehydrogenase